MSEERLARIEADLAAIKAMLGERCVVRGTAIDDHERRLTKLEDAEQRREGGKAALMGIVAAAATLGGVVAKLLPLGK